MWIKLHFGFKDPVLAAIGMDGEIYFLAKDVAGMLGYKDRYGFAKRYGTRDLAKLIPEDFCRFLQKGRRFVFGFEEMMETIRGTLGFHATPPEQLLELRQLWREGVVYNQMPSVMPFAPSVAFPVRVMMMKERGMVTNEDVGGQLVLFRDWLAAYAEKTLSYFESNCKVLVAPPSVESDFGGGGEDLTKDKEFPEIRRRFGNNGTWKNGDGFAMIVRAEGVWSVKSPEVIQDAMLTVKRKMEELEEDYGKMDEGNRMYELQVKLRRRERIELNC